VIWKTPMRALLIAPILAPDEEAIASARFFASSVARSSRLVRKSANLVYIYSRETESSATPWAIRSPALRDTRSNLSISVDVTL